MAKTIKEQADEYVEMFYQFGLDKIDCTRCAIIHVEGLIQELEIMYHLCCPEINIEYYKQILTELKSRI